jgi:hypothetical protein
MDYNKSQKGQKGFTKKYKALGELKQIRVPVSLESDIKTILELLEIIARRENNMVRVNNIMKKIIEILNDDIVTG